MRIAWWRILPFAVLDLTYLAVLQPHTIAVRAYRELAHCRLSSYLNETNLNCHQRSLGKDDIREASHSSFKEAPCLSLPWVKAATIIILTTKGQHGIV